MSASIFMQGLGLGLAAAAPIGPVNIEIIRRTLTRGLAAGMSLGLGACTADMAYLSLVLAGAASWAGQGTVRTVMLTTGGGFLVLLGLLAAWSTRRGIREIAERLEQPRQSVSARKAYLTGLLMTLSNPMTIAYWVSVSAKLSGESFRVGRYIYSLAGVAAGTVGWVAGISASVAMVSHLGRRFAGPGALAWLLLAANILGSLLLTAFGVAFILSAYRIG